MKLKPKAVQGTGLSKAIGLTCIAAWARIKLSEARTGLTFDGGLEYRRAATASVVA
jgi:hypothetical protein